MNDLQFYGHTTKAFQKPGRVKSSGSDLDICRKTQSLGLLVVTRTEKA